MRALAHPARIALWQHLLLEGPATATECAPVADLSPSACSYHLRQLARFGFVEQDQASAANGRERPWRAVISSTTVEDLDDPVAVMAARLLDYSLEERWQAVRSRYENSKQDYPAEWRRRQAATGPCSTRPRTSSPRCASRSASCTGRSSGCRARNARRGPAGAGRNRLRAAVRPGRLLGRKAWLRLTRRTAGDVPADGSATAGGSASTGESAATDGADR